MTVPGWYGDPIGQAQFRWWDGNTWTVDVHDGIVAGGNASEPTTSTVLNTNGVLVASKRSIWWLLLLLLLLVASGVMFLAMASAFGWWASIDISDADSANAGDPFPWMLVAGIAAPGVACMVMAVLVCWFMLDHKR